MTAPEKTLAVWALTPGGCETARQIAEHWPQTTVCLPVSMTADFPSAVFFQKFSESVKDLFHEFDGHVFIMSTGIVVRTIAALLRGKTEDPAAVVLDERRLHAVSLISGHIGGANALALQLAEITGATPVITTATDLNALPAIDVIAVERGLAIENPSAIKDVSMAFLRGEAVGLHDPYGLIRDVLPPEKIWRFEAETADSHDGVRIFADDREIQPVGKTLVLRPRTLVAGMGCNRNTEAGEMEALVRETLSRFRLSPLSLKAIATVDIKKDEAGLISLAEILKIPLIFFNRQQLKTVSAIQNPSETVLKHIGVPSVCEAAAILGSENGNLIIPKQRTKNATLAIAGRRFIS